MNKEAMDKGSQSRLPVAKDKYENLLLALLEQQDAATEVWSYPTGLLLDPSSVCQLKCPFCIHHLANPVRSKTVMQWELFERLFAEMGRFLFEVWLFNWGEPFANKHIVDMLALLKKHQVYTRISSHLSLPLSDSMVEKLIELQLDWLTVSIDGMSQETYGTYRAGGNFQVALANMEKIAKAKKRLGSSKPHIDWQYLVFSFNERELPAAREHAKRIGVDFRPAAPYIDVATHSHWLSTIDEYVMDIYKKKPAVGTPTAQPAITQSVEDHMKALSAPRRVMTCDWHYIVSALNANGSVSPCCSIMIENEDFENVADGPFREVWNGDKFRSARRHYRNEGHSNNGDTPGLVCFNCNKRELMVYGQGIARRALTNAPADIQQQARLLLPDHPLVKELFPWPLDAVASYAVKRQDVFTRKLLQFIRHSLKAQR